jgi:UDP-N-acetylmuramoyl-tripeptide--D-alanyl-D-alanine ligase
MRELGTYSNSSHSMIAKLCNELRLDSVLVGEEFKAVEESFSSCSFYSSVEELIKALEGKKIKGKTILLKGSRGMAMERLLPLL